MESDPPKDEDQMDSPKDEDEADQQALESLGRTDLLGNPGREQQTNQPQRQGLWAADGDRATVEVARGINACPAGWALTRTRRMIFTPRSWNPPSLISTQLGVIFPARARYTRPLRSRTECSCYRTYCGRIYGHI